MDLSCTLAATSGELIIQILLVFAHKIAHELSLFESIIIPQYWMSPRLKFCSCIAGVFFINISIRAFIFSGSNQEPM